jgi:hypothetical protein
MIHGNCTASAGCFVLTDSQVQEVYAIAREALNGGQSSIQVQAYPFRLTASNLAKHRRNPNIAFWRMIKQGYDHFEVTHLEPKVDVCDKKYVFDAKPAAADAASFNPQGACPAYQIQPDIAVAVAEKQKADEAEFKVQVAALDAQEKAAADAELAMKMEAAKPKPVPTSLFASLTPKPAAATSGPLAVSVADAKPIDMPVPKPSPIAVAQAPVVASAYGATDKPAGDMFGGIMNLVKLPGSDAPAATPVAPAQPAVQPAVATAQTPEVKGVTQVKATATSVPTPTAAKPTVVATTSQTTARSMPPSPVMPAAEPMAAAPAPVEKPWWKKLNPFGG